MIEGSPLIFGGLFFRSCNLFSFKKQKEYSGVIKLRREILNFLERRIIQNLLDVVILLELRKHSLSGYDVYNLVLKEFRKVLSPGIIYGRLYSMERKELIKGEFRFRRRVYVLTQRGEEAAKELAGSRDRVMLIVMKLFSR